MAQNEKHEMEENPFADLSGVLSGFCGPDDQRAIDEHARLMQTRKTGTKEAFHQGLNSQLEQRQRRVEAQHQRPTPRRSITTYEYGSGGGMDGLEF